MVFPCPRYAALVLAEFYTWLWEVGANSFIIPPAAEFS